MGANGRLKPRREHDAYYTPGWMVRALLKYGPFDPTAHRRNADLRIFEPCVGDGAIVAELVKAGFLTGLTNDIDPKITASFHRDASQPWPDEWQFDWTVSNTPWAMPKNKPPLPLEILKQALAHSRLAVSLLLRITFLEPCENRGVWLQEHPPDQIIVLPRYSFTQDGKSDSATACWFTWLGPDLAGMPLYRAPHIVIAEDAERL